MNSGELSARGLCEHIDVIARSRPGDSDAMDFAIRFHPVFNPCGGLSHHTNSDHLPLSLLVVVQVSGMMRIVTTDVHGCSLGSKSGWFLLMNRR